MAPFETSPSYDRTSVFRSASSFCERQSWDDCTNRYSDDATLIIKSTPKENQDMNGFSERRITCLHHQDSLQIPETRTSFHFGEKRSAECELHCNPVREFNNWRRWNDDRASRVRRIWFRSSLSKPVTQAQIGNVKSEDRTVFLGWIIPFEPPAKIVERLNHVECGRLSVS
jgi:hypothetical protein